MIELDEAAITDDRTSTWKVRPWKAPVVSMEFVRPGVRVGLPV